MYVPAYVRYSLSKRHKGEKNSNSDVQSTIIESLDIARQEKTISKIASHHDASYIISYHMYVRQQSALQSSNNYCININY